MDDALQTLNSADAIISGSVKPKIPHKEVVLEHVSRTHFSSFYIPVISELLWPSYKNVTIALWALNLQTLYYNCYCYMIYTEVDA